MQWRSNRRRPHHPASNLSIVAAYLVGSQWLAAIMAICSGSYRHQSIVYQAYQWLTNLAYLGISLIISSSQWPIMAIL